MKNLVKVLACAMLAATMMVGVGFGTMTANAASPTEAVSADATDSNAVTADGREMYNGYIKLVCNSSNGRFVLGTTGGNPDSDTDNKKKLLYGFPDLSSSGGTSKTTIVVDDVINYYGDGSSSFEVVPHNDADAKANLSSIYHGKVLVEQQLSFVRNISTGRDDVLEIRYTATNTDTVAHEVGVRIMMDTMLGDNDSAPFRVAGVGDVTTEMTFNGDELPQYWQAFDDLTEPTVISQGSFFRDGDNRNNPDQVQFCSWSRITDTLWGYVTTEGRNNGDSAVSVTWNKKTLAPGESRTYVTYYGLSELTQDVTPPLSLSVYGDSVVTSKKVDPATDLPVYNDFTVTAYVQNVAEIDATNSFAKLILPTGFSIVNGSAKQTIGTLTPGKETQVSWTVKAAGNIDPGTYKYKVICGCTETDNKTVERPVNVPVVLKNTSTATEHLTIGETAKVKASATGGYGTYLFSMYYKKDGADAWTKLSDYSTTATASFKPTETGTYQVLVKVKDGNGSISDKTLTVNVYKKLANASSLKAEVINLGQDAVLNGKATGGSGDYQFAYYYKRATASQWIEIKDFSKTTKASVAPKAAIDYDLKVVAKDMKTNKTAEKTFKLTVKDPLVNQATISAETIVKGKTVTVKNAAKGGSGSYTYAVLYKQSGSDNWTTKQDFCDTLSTEIKPAHAGNYDILVKVKDANGDVDEKSFVVKVNEALVNTSALADDQVMLGKKATVNCAATGGMGGYTYAVYLKKASDTNYTTVQDYKDTATVEVTPQKATTYNVLVKVKDAEGNVSKKVLVLKVAPKLAITATLDKTQIVLGESVKASATAKGGIGEYTYAFYYKKVNGTEWSKKQDFKANSSVTITPKVATEYEVCVKVKDSKGNVDKQYLKFSVAKALVNTSTISIGDKLVINASGTGGIGAHTYAVMMKKSSETQWTTPQNFKDNATVELQLEKGVSYDICVKVKDSEGRIAKRYVTIMLGQDW